ncbi:MAG: bifunctional 3-(3-hydroxy-phenyl)propionate/3-hydroxycinnamic acid hydroxylase [Pseudomonadota bacterium]
MSGVHAAGEAATLFDVAVVGMGPVGAFAALLFAEAGLSVAAIERDVEVYRLPRAVNLDGEVVRAFQRIGRGEAVDALLQSVRPGERAGFANGSREWLFGQEQRDFGSHGWQPANMFDQPEFEGYLRAEALAHDGVTDFVGWELRGYGADADSVAATVDLELTKVDGSTSRALRARYVVACDGAGSSTRAVIGSNWESLGYDRDWLVVDVEVRDGHTLALDTLQVCDPDRLLTYVCTKDPYRRWEFRLKPDETAKQMLRETTIRALIDPWTPRDTYTVRRAAVYQFHAATASRWYAGRIFIAGDAAHQTPPFLGQGMNTGMRDVINLAWKLPLVLDGGADASLLDSYQLERDAHARDLVEWAVSIGRLMEHLADQERARRAGEPEPPMPAALRSAGYGQGRGQPPVRAGVLCAEQVGHDSATGHLLSQPIVRDASGRELRLDDLLGGGFCLLGRTAEDLVVSDRSRRVLDALGARIVSLDGLTTVRGRFDRLFSNHAVALVRPDRVVFGCTTETVAADDLVAELAEKLALREYSDVS